MNKKKHFANLLVVLLTASIIACNGSSSSTPSNTGDGTPITQPETPSEKAKIVIDGKEVEISIPVDKATQEKIIDTVSAGNIAAVVTSSGNVFVVDKDGKPTKADIKFDTAKNETVISTLIVGAKTNPQVAVITSTGNLNIIDKTGNIVTKDLQLDETKKEQVINSVQLGEKVAVTTSAGNVFVADAKGDIAKADLKLDANLGETVLSAVNFGDKTIPQLGIVTSTGKLNIVDKDGNVVAKDLPFDKDISEHALSVVSLGDKTTTNLAITTNTNKLVIVDKAGAAVKTVAIPVDSKNNADGVVSSVTIGEGDNVKVVTTTNYGKLSIIDKDGKVVDATVKLDANQLEQVVTSNSVGGKVAVITSTGKLQLLDKDGKLSPAPAINLPLNAKTGEVIRNSVTANDGKILTVTDQGRVLSIDENGKVTEVSNISKDSKAITISNVTSKGLIAIDSAGNATLINKDGTIKQISEAIKFADKNASISQSFQIGDKIYLKSSNHGGNPVIIIDATGTVSTIGGENGWIASISVSNNVLISSGSSANGRPYYSVDGSDWQDLINTVPTGEFDERAKLLQEQIAIDKNQGFAMPILIGDKIVFTGTYGNYYTKHLGGNNFAPWKKYGKGTPVDNKDYQYGYIRGAFGDRVIFNSNNSDKYYYVNDENDIARTFILDDGEQPFESITFAQAKIFSSSLEYTAVYNTRGGFDKQGNWYQLGTKVNQGVDGGKTGLFVSHYDEATKRYGAVKLVAGSDQFLTKLDIDNNVFRVINEQIFVTNGNKIHKLVNATTGEWQQVGGDLSGQVIHSRFTNGNLYITVKGEQQGTKYVVLKDNNWVAVANRPVADSIWAKSLQQK